MSAPPLNNNQENLEPCGLGVRYFLLAIFTAIFFLGKILFPFWSILVLSFLLSNLFRPVYTFLKKKMGETLASVLTCLLITLIVFIPLVFFVGALSNEALSLYNWGRDTQIGLKIQLWLQESAFIAQLQGYLTDFGISFDTTQVSGSVSYLAKVGGLYLYNQASAWAANILQFLVLFVMMILVIFFLLIDMPKLIAFIIELSPLPDEEDRTLLEKFEEIANAILKGNGICGLIQGVLGGAVFSILGLNSPILWGAVMSILAFLPIFGVGLVMIPAAVILAFGDRLGAGIFLFIFYIVLSFSIEYVVKPKMVGDQVKMHTLLVFLSIIGGLSVYGVLGIIYGPLIITAFLTLTNIYLNKYAQFVRKI